MLTQKKTSNGKEKEKKNNEAEEEAWILLLYVAGQNRNSRTAFENLRNICETHLTRKYTIEVIDLLENPQLAKEHQIVAVPTVIRKLPAPVRKIIGNLSSTEKVLVGLDLLKGEVR